ncbi:TPA: copper homeostasis protein CutC [Streptococcus equi subsp. zooepidemicus]|uniref:PF03932 family protein CutC n=1 Tax=Streptococcus equi subsp. zooepidemicus TaxID=40041 RepID=A0AAX2LE31_STRSZ|nr:copper homeostasis protein CutC [Streptococcus equi]KIS12568.1 CutC family protein [Streptococcus equi subsp. zooepidemicus Sz57]MCD3408714.1 copper homeostasis protein CutC [Streptococcus equi subsp. zooepidemicus]MCD3445593.1 copper homeostasis protein CutC [Streptococcus equi subsp. zooepidemicus]MCD3447738.1 copper homeostasis protein CutC [Streptococcus equi subsp. zooepidemicus]SQE95404.1 CutC family protein [Streptococcus equi subsp. zooepidemicus]
MIKEFCAENLTMLSQLTSQSVSRVELCDNLAVGGTTPSYGVIKEACDLLHDKQISVATMIRPRGGDFVYNDLELRAMAADILKAIEAGTDALVMGLLTKDNQLDTDAIEQLLPATQGLPLVFHMAFDLIARDQQIASLEQLIDYGFVRILLHGSSDTRSIYENIDHIKQLVKAAQHRIEIMIGGGVTADNCQELSQLTGTAIVHGTKII